jgi:hypothetical protein
LSLYLLRLASSEYGKQLSAALHGRASLTSGSGVAQLTKTIHGRPQTGQNKCASEGYNFE